MVSCTSLTALQQQTTRATPQPSLFAATTRFVHMRQAGEVLRVRSVRMLGLWKDWAMFRELQEQEGKEMHEARQPAATLGHALTVGSRCMTHTG
eukprot:CAMPEP_0175958198 /NCGR_PEP_ID=MMETSP0108-20121206/34116_1 /TAXON_ID=195067 ORGANISM="Goniomonas pacifica, Strain CCMP1869" /NCGR_SAMPLE_ID=MMETSP0108 /ASSEMBLY_ACC=CAM_ASM_000204 /LENGTH=93 /DNA_ID=CAMNT_0017285529 /DNA_START=1149 /DNA_END=1427 /DNA_ORIENTATION=+